MDKVNKHLIKRYLVEISARLFLCQAEDTLNNVLLKCAQFNDTFMGKLKRFITKTFFDFVNMKKNNILVELAS